MDGLTEGLRLHAIRQQKAVAYSRRLRTYVDPNAVVVALVTNPGEESMPLLVRAGRLDRPASEAASVAMVVDEFGVAGNAGRLRFFYELATMMNALVDDDQVRQVILPSRADVAAFRGLVIHASDFTFSRPDLEPEYLAKLRVIRRFGLLYGFHAVVQPPEASASCITASAALRAHYAFPMADVYADNLFALEAYRSPGVPTDVRRAEFERALRRTSSHVVKGEDVAVLDSALRQPGDLAPVLSPVVEPIYAAARATALELLEAFPPLGHLLLIRIDEGAAWRVYRARIEDHEAYVEAARTTEQRDVRSKSFVLGLFTHARENIRGFLFAEDNVKLWQQRNLRFDPVERARARVANRKIATGVVVEMDMASHRAVLACDREATDFGADDEVHVLRIDASEGVDATVAFVEEGLGGLTMSLRFDPKRVASSRIAVGTRLDVVERSLDLRHMTADVMRSRLGSGRLEDGRRVHWSLQAEGAPPELPSSVVAATEKASRAAALLEI